jgi:mono/diheme cytochrome c family protein
MKIEFPFRNFPFVGLLSGMFLILSSGSLQADPIRKGPQPIKPAEHGIGQLVKAFSFSDINGEQHTFGSEHAAQLTAFCFTSTSCPLSRKYLPTLAKLSQSAPAHVQYILVNPIQSDKKENMQAAAQQARNAIYVHDADGKLSQYLQAQTTTDVIVVDAHRTVVYHGAIDDQYGFGYARAEPKQHFLKDAIESLLQGQQPSIAATDAPGCDLSYEVVKDTAGMTTYHGEISRILQRNCIECHRKGGIGPFPLDSYEDVVAHAGMIQTVVTNKTMPPWFAEESRSSKTSTTNHQHIWKNDRSLTADDRNDLLAWVQSDHPLGNLADAPKPMTFPTDWQIGKPDRVWKFSEPIPVQATGVMPYQYITIDTQLDESKWVQAIEIQPGSPEVVHHVIITLHIPGQGKRSSAEREEDGLWAGYVPGQSVWKYPKGFARYLPKGSRLIFQMHYTPNGIATTDQTRVGVIYADAPPEHEVRIKGLSNHHIRIPPFAKHHREEASLKLPVDATVLGFLPHMHLRGSACRYEVIDTTGRQEVLLDIPQYDFNWQLLYRYTEPRTFHEGDTITFTAWFDNSAENPANPDPTETVYWGQQTFEEMLLGYVEYFLPGVPPGTPLTNTARSQKQQGNLPARDNKNFQAFFLRFDQDGDHALSKEELPNRLRSRFNQVDSDRNGLLSYEEVQESQAQ